VLKSYLKIAVRNLLKHKAYSLINLLGLSVSLAVGLLMVLFIKEQKSYEQFHQHRQRIFRIISAVAPAPEGKTTTFASSPAPLAPMLLKNYPNLEAITRLSKLSATALHEGKSLAISGLWAEPAFFQIFDFALLAGDPQKALHEPNALVISPETAIKFFGAENPLGKVLALEGAGDFVVTGILQKPAGKTHLQSEVIASCASLVLARRSMPLAKILLGEKKT